MDDPIAIKIPLLGPLKQDLKRDAVVIAMASLFSRDEQTKWLNKLIQFVGNNDPGKKGLIISIHPPKSSHLIDIPRASREDLARDFRQVLVNIVAVGENRRPISLEPITQHFCGHLDILFFIESSDYANNGSLTDLALTLLPAILHQLQSQYDYILIDLPDFWYPRVQSIVAISSYLLLPYNVAHADMMDKIFDFNSYFMRLASSGGEFDCGGIIPFFAGRKPGTYGQDFNTLQHIFGSRLWPLIPDAKEISQMTLDAHYESTFIKFLELIRRKKYRAKKLAILDKVYTLLARPNGYIERKAINQLTVEGTYGRLIELFSLQTNLSTQQKYNLRSLNYSSLLKLMVNIYSNWYGISIDHILFALDMKDTLKSEIILMKIGNKRELSLKEMGEMLDIPTDNLSRYVFRISLTKHWSLKSCKRKLASSRP